MYAPIRPLLPALATCTLLLAPVSGMGGSELVQQGNASAALDFRIVIPPFMRVLENSHPRQMDTSAEGEVSAEQRLVVLSNLKRGFCVSLVRTTPRIGTWTLQTDPQSGIELSPSADGYRLCGTRPGRFTVLLQHRFVTGEGSTNALDWPVRTDISAI